MAFTRGWNNATPAGTRLANEIDDAIRELKVDMSERLISKIFNSMPNTTVEADLVVKPEILGNKTKRLLIHGNVFQADEGAAADYATDGFTTDQASAPVRGNVYLPPGVTITQIRWLISSTIGTPSVTISFKSMAFLVALTQTTHDTKTMALSTTPAFYGNGALAVPDQITTDDNHCYYLEIDMAGSSGLIGFIVHGVEITYTTPDCRSTL